MSDGSRYKLVQLPSGSHAVYAADYDEKMHPGLGPQAEADLLYVRQLKIRERMQAQTGEFVVWDVGLGAAANEITLLRQTRDRPCPLRLLSFDNTDEPVRFALAQAGQLGYFDRYEMTVCDLLEHHNTEFADGEHTVHWEFHVVDFPAWLECRSTHRRVAEDPPKLARPGTGTPHAIFFDAFSPAKNPAMWTLSLFTNLFQSLDPARLCSLTTYSRSTMLRVTLLLAGFFVGRGAATGLKEETTVAANTLELLEEPLDRRWLDRAQRSDSAEPLTEPKYRRAPISPANWEKLNRHQQFIRSGTVY